ncbi:hypothetical protein GE09DRAFT_547167 [Coniochaeta sp. 2T2.1]|nr:hypothetical protein GE09DRAFT_547167 [Coniochaeta sp. 2T2.1]
MDGDGYIYALPVAVAALHRNSSTICCPKRPSRVLDRATTWRTGTTATPGHMVQVQSSQCSHISPPVMPRKPGVDRSLEAKFGQTVFSKLSMRTRLMPRQLAMPHQSCPLTRPSTRSSSPRSTATVNRQPDLGTRKQNGDEQVAASPGTRFYTGTSSRNMQRRREYDEPIRGGGPSDISDSSSSDEAIATEISLKLKLIRKALVACKGVCEEYENEFQLHAGKLAWATKDTLDKLWCDMIANHGNPDRLPKATEKLRSSMSPLKSVLNASRNADRMRQDDRDDTEVLKCRQRAAGYTEYRYTGLLDLLHRARTERTAGRMLLGEIRELISELDPKTHPMLYDDGEDDGEEEKPTKQGHTKGPQNAKQGKNGPAQNGGRSALKSQAPKGLRNSPSRGNTPRSRSPMNDGDSSHNQDAQDSYQPEDPDSHQRTSPPDKGAGDNKVTDGNDEDNNENGDDEGRQNGGDQHGSGKGWGAY